MRCLNGKIICICGFLITVIFPIDVILADVVENENIREIEEEVVEENLSIEDFLQGVLAVVPEIVEVTEDVMEYINMGDYGDAFNTVAGAVGLLNPLEEGNSISSSENIYSNSTSSTKASAADTGQSQVAQRLSEIVFSEIGQEAIAEQNQILEESQQAANLAQEESLKAYEKNNTLIQDSINFSNDITEEANEAQSARASQDVLKAISSQTDYESQILTIISKQLGTLSESQVYNGLHLKGLNTQLTIANQREQNMLFYMASNGLQLSEIDNNLEQQINLLNREKSEKRLRSEGGTSKIYIPGLFIQEITEEKVD